MTIRQRLYFSNILMIVMPIVLTGIVLGGLFFIFSETFGSDFINQWQENELYTKEYDRIEALQKKFQVEDPTQAQLIQALDDLNKEQPASEVVSVLLYDSDRALLQRRGTYQEDSIVKSMLDNPDQHTLVVNKVLMNRITIGQFQVLLVNQNYHMNLEEQLLDNKRMIFLVVLLIVVCVILFVVLTNYILSRFIFRPINDGLTVLLQGVQQIRDGNLSWRTDYQEEEEFRPVVNSLNEMAERLEILVTEQEKNSENRKELIAGISHDLRTPLTAIKAYVEGLEKGIATTPAMKEKYLKTITKKTDELTHLVDQLFLFSKVDLGDFALRIQNVTIGKYLADLIEGVTEEYRQRGLKITLGVHSYQTQAAVDPEQLRTVFINIIENTVKYGHPSDNQLLIEQYEESEKIVITFSDNGPGVPWPQQKNLFDVFYRGDKARTQSGEGSGLGLAIARRVIESQGGEIEARDSSKGGLQIRIQLPISKDAPTK